MTKKDAYAEGFDHGIEAAENCDYQDGEDKRGAAFEAEDNQRQYSPWEFLASEINSCRNSESLWESYDKGVADGIDSVLKGETNLREDISCQKVLGQELIMAWDKVTSIE